MEANSTVSNLPRQLAQIVAGSIDGRTGNIRYRQKEFHRLQNSILENLNEFKQAITDDSGNTPEEVQMEVTLALKEIHTHYASLDVARNLEVEYRIANGKDNRDQKRGAGIVYVIPSQHTLFYSVIAALSAALAAGNSFVVEIPKTTLRVSSLLRSILPKTLDRDTFAIVETRPDDGFLRSAIVLSQQSQPEELRTVAIVDRTANLEDAVVDLVISCFAFNGRSPYSPDVILVNDFCVQPFIDLLIKHAPSYLGRGLQQAKKVPRKGSGASLLERIASEEGCQVVVSGTGWAVAKVQDRNSFLLKSKIDERLLLIHQVASLDDAINFCNSMGTLNATYTFAAPTAAKYISESIDAGLAWINHVPYDMLIGPVLPLNTALSQETRYAPDLFQVSRGQILHKSPNTLLAKSLLKSAGKPQIGASLGQFMGPLPSLQQRPGHKIGFFEQGFVTGGILILTSLFAMGAAAGYHVWKMR
ncbi:aldehyde dehydrogenase PutA [Penicillium concentricum]|uniref:Aldehyde dehydrogenase PutA n=1 Tax=Penicillium concentricum TaxID=293559 RepID=A0A9W9S5G9_9EURO|nr:aldehyde dehydrogenase PutA [Penicillium concentricum]KAJ5372047.1 aldehyde dehydrogenase PutA [Penicillium concentricum]